jgi:hypothetical protein
MATETVEQALERITGSNMSDDAKMAAFMAFCIQQNYAEYAAIMRPTIENYQREIAELYKLVGDIRRLIKAACSGEHMPNPAYILACLYPTPEMLTRLDQFAEA